MRPLVAHLSRAALRHNYQQFPPNTWAVIKADGYGFGAVEVAKTLPDAPGFAVACIEEAIVLREGGIQGPILVLEGPFEPTEWMDIGAYQLDAVVHSPEQLDGMLELRQRSWAGIWLKIDTGMHRLGMSEPVALTCAQRIAGLAIQRRVWMAHFACADDVNAQLPLSAAPPGFALSLNNSAAGLTRHELPDNWSRAGIALFGASSVQGRSADDLGLKCVQRLCSQVVALREVPQGESVGYGGRWTASRDSRIATLPGGYADGYSRQMPDGTPVMIQGHLAPLAGRVSMDRITVDVTDFPDVQVGAAAELWGSQVSVDQVATAANTIAYELFCNVARRVPRIWSEA